MFKSGIDYTDDHDGPQSPEYNESLCTGFNFFSHQQETGILDDSSSSLTVPTKEKAIKSEKNTTTKVPIDADKERKSNHSILRNSELHDKQIENESSPPPNVKLDIRNALPSKKRVTLVEPQPVMPQKERKVANNQSVAGQAPDNQLEKTSSAETCKPALSLHLLKKQDDERHVRRSKADDAVLGEMLNLPEYEELKDQLVNLAAAKLSGNFTYQVAASVESLMKCANKSRDEAMEQFEQARASLTQRVTAISGLLKNQLDECDTHYQNLVDERLAELSAVLDDIKTNQEELSRFRQLVKSLTNDLISEQ